MMRIGTALTWINQWVSLIERTLLNKKIAILEANRPFGPAEDQP
jgi:hypothetical protein